MKSFKQFNEKIVFPNGSDYYITAAKFFLEKMGIDHSKIQIAIVFKDKMNGDDGFTTQSPKNPKQFLINLKKGHPKADLLRLIAHEMTHVKQLVNGDLKFDFENGKILWKGKDFDVDKTPYRKRPFEIEAFKEEKKYIQDFIKKYGNE